MAGLLSLKWNNHSTAFLQNIEKIHLKEKYCDATIICQGQYFPVHRIVLSTCSLYFEEMFETINSQHPFIVFKDINPREMELMLNYMYKGEINVEQHMIPILVTAAEALKLKGIAVPDDFPSSKSSSERKRTNTSDDNSASKRRSDDVKRTSTSRSKISSTYSNLSNSHTLEESRKLSAAEPVLIKEEPVDYNLSEMAHSYNAIPSERNKDVTRLNLPTKSEVIFDSTENLSSFVENEKQLPRLARNDSNFDSISAHDNSNEQDNNPESNFESWKTESNANVASENLYKSTEEARLEMGSNSSHEMLGVEEGIERPNDSTLNKPYHCSICGRYFIQKQHLQNHMHIHTGIKNFACVKCSKRFAFKQQLQIHLRVHTGEKPYSCKQCPKKFRQKCHLNSHIACVHF